MQKDVKNNLHFAAGLLPAVRTADATGTSVDHQEARGTAHVAMVGAPGDTLSSSVKIEFEVQHSDDDSSYSACADTDIDAAVTGTNTGTFASVQANADASKIYKCNYIGAKRYSKVIENRTGTHTNGTPTAVFAVQNPTVLPAT